VRSPDFRGWVLLGAAALGIALPGVLTPGGSAYAGGTLEERKLPMHLAGSRASRIATAGSAPSAS
jgi:hypothetical protein